MSEKEPRKNGIKKEKRFDTTKRVKTMEGQRMLQILRAFLTAWTQLAVQETS